MNKAILIGNLTRDPEMRTTSSTGIPMCTFGIAVNRRIPNAQGVREADFFNIVSWRGLAENCGRYLTKGKKVAVVGQIQVRTYDAQDGTKRTVVEILADDVEFLNTQTDLQNAPQHPSGVPTRPATNAPVTQTYGSDAGFTAVEDDDLPF